MENSVASLNAAEGEMVKPYKIHVSSKYLDLTKKKLELTRLPHELLVPKGREWENGTPKSEVEPLIDYWLETYTWRQRESHLNTTLPQYRTAISLLAQPHPLRIHFLHLKSSHASAIPLLLIPSFPLPNLSPLLEKLLKPLTDPEEGGRAFHVVVPSIPGLGFSDAFQAEDGLLAGTAEVFNTLMTQRLGYEFYLASATGSGRDSPAGIDYHLASLMGETFPDNCLGTHLIEPLVVRPKVGSWAWMKFSAAKFFHAELWGYSKLDFAALRERRTMQPTRGEGGQRRSLLPKKPSTGYGTIGMLGLREPNTLAYGLCDSPVGLLSLVCSVLRRKSPNHSLSDEIVVDVCQMAWLPGPEAGMRFWSAAVKEADELEKVHGTKARVAVTAFLEGGEEGGYICPAWAGRKHAVVFSQRAEGRAGLVAWERTGVVIDGIRGLAAAVERLDGRLSVRELESVVVGGEPTIDEAEDEDSAGVQWDVESPDTIVAVDLSR